MKKILLLIFVLIGIAVALLWLQAKPEGSVKIGFISPLTGNVADWGVSGQNAVTLAVEAYNAKNPGRSIDVIYEDDQCESDKAVSAAQKLLSVDKVKVLIMGCSGSTLAVAPLAAQHDAIIMTYATAAKISGLGPQIFRSSYSDAIIARVAAQTMYHDKLTRAGIISETSQYSLGIRDDFVSTFRVLGGEVIETEFPENALDMRTQLTQVVAQKPDALFLNPNGTQTGLILLKQLRELGYRGKLYANYFPGNEMVQMNPLSEGVIFFADPNVIENESKNKFLQQHQARFDRSPFFEFPAFATYDGMNALLRALEETNGSSDQISHYLKSNSFEGIVGKFNFDTNGDLTGVLPSIKQIKNKTVVPYTN